MSDLALVKLGNARLALAECKTAMDAKQIMDVAEAARVYLERTHASAETVNNATEIRLLAERQMGEFLKSMPKNPGGNPLPEAAASRREGAPLLEDMGINYKQSSNAQKLAAIPAEEFQERIAVAKASGGKLSTRAVLHQWSPKAKAAAAEADKDSDFLWKMKSLWRKASKKDRRIFLLWTNSHS